MDQIVLDASVVAKLFLKEEGSSAAIKLKDKHIADKIKIMIPSLLKYELTSVLKAKNFPNTEINSALEVIKGYGFSIVTLDDYQFDKIVEMSSDYNISVYDATYVLIAKKNGALLYTADGKILPKVKKLKFVGHLSTF